LRRKSEISVVRLSVPGKHRAVEILRISTFASVSFARARIEKGFRIIA